MPLVRVILFFTMCFSQRGPVFQQIDVEDAYGGSPTFRMFGITEVNKPPLLGALSGIHLAL